MRCFLFYISDWKSSKQIARMDAAEERGYLRLLLDAAESPDCGLPDDDDELRTISLLKKQWFQVTQDEDYQYGTQKSGQKLRACFFRVKDGLAINGDSEDEYVPSSKPLDLTGLKEGRLYNERLLREFRHQQEVSEARKAASDLGVKARQKNRFPSDDENFLAELESSGPEGTTPLPPPKDQSDPSQPDDQMVDHAVYQLINQTDNKLSLSLCLSLEESISLSSLLQISEGFNYPHAFAYLARRYHKTGRLRLRKAYAHFVDQLSDARDPVSLFARMLCGLSVWNASEPWRRGAVNHIANWLPERLYDEKPVSAAEVDEQRNAQKVARMPPRKPDAMDEARALAKAQAEKRRAS